MAYTTRTATRTERIMAARNDNYMRAVRMLQECYTVCQKALTANSPKEAGQSMAYLHLKRLRACSEICESTARLLLKDGIGAEDMCEITAHICEQCASSCEKEGSASMQRVADICRQTAEACLDESYRIKSAKPGPLKPHENLTV
jgi:hypothetical protein